MRVSRGAPTTSSTGARPRRGRRLHSRRSQDCDPSCLGLRCFAPPPKLSSWGLAWSKGPPVGPWELLGCQKICGVCYIGMFFPNGSPTEEHGQSYDTQQKRQPILVLLCTCTSRDRVFLAILLCGHRRTNTARRRGAPLAPTAPASAKTSRAVRIGHAVSSESKRTAVLRTGFVTLSNEAAKPHKATYVFTPAA